MPIKAPSFRHVVENFENKVRVTIPSRKNFLYFVWFTIWLIVWGYATSRLFLLWELAIRSVRAGHGNVAATMLIICLVPFLVVSLGMIAFAIHTALWHLSGKEIIEVTPQSLTVIKQVFRWKWSKVHSSDKIHKLRTNTQRLSMFFPRKKVKSFLGGPGMIAFDDGGRFSNFGFNINEEEAEHIILVLKDRLPQQNAG